MQDIAVNAATVGSKLWRADGDSKRSSIAGVLRSVVSCSITITGMNNSLPSRRK